MNIFNFTESFMVFINPVVIYIIWEWKKNKFMFLKNRNSIRISGVLKFRGVIDIILFQHFIVLMAKGQEYKKLNFRFLTTVVKGRAINVSEEEFLPNIL